MSDRIRWWKEKDVNHLSDAVRLGSDRYAYGICGKHGVSLSCLPHDANPADIVEGFTRLRDAWAEKEGQG